MNVIETVIECMEFSRGRTLALLEKIEALPDPAAVLGWRPGPGRAHLAWQFMHIAVTEEIFATERLSPEKAATWTELWPRFRGGSTPDNDIPDHTRIQEVLSGARESLSATLRDIPLDQMDQVPPPLAERGWTHRRVLDVLLWHEAHHQGQAHAVLNLYLASGS